MPVYFIQANNAEIVLNWLTLGLLIYAAISAFFAWQAVVVQYLLQSICTLK